MSVSRRVVSYSRKKNIGIACLKLKFVFPRWTHLQESRDPPSWHQKSGQHLLHEWNSANNWKTAWWFEICLKYVATTQSLVDNKVNHHGYLGGGLNEKHVMFISVWGNDPIWRIYISDGLVKNHQPEEMKDLRIFGKYSVIECMSFLFGVGGGMHFKETLPKLFGLLPGKLTCTLKMNGWKMYFLLK